MWWSVYHCSACTFAVISAVAKCDIKSHRCHDAPGLGDGVATALPVLLFSPGLVICFVYELGYTRIRDYFFSDGSDDEP